MFLRTQSRPMLTPQRALWRKLARPRSRGRVTVTVNGDTEAEAETAKRPVRAYAGT
jgi:hypothetical protein